jgi:AsmA protein
VAGQGNWEAIGKTSDQVSSEHKGEEERGPEKGLLEGLPIKSLAVGECAVKDASLVFIDHGSGERKEVSDVTLRLEDVSLDRPIHVALAGKVMQWPFSLEGKAGPLGREIGKGTIPLEFAVKALKELNVNLKGRVVDPATSLQFDLAFETAPFSPRKVLASLDETLTVETADPNALKTVAIKAELKGDLKQLSLSGGVIDLDESKLTLSAQARDYLSRPDLTFDLGLDEMDVGRYLPPSAEKQSQDVRQQPESAEPRPKPTDYTTPRKVVLDGSVHIGKLKAYGALMEDIELRVSGKEGHFRLAPLTLKLYQGDVSAQGSVDVRQDEPRSELSLDAKGIQVGPLLKDVLSKSLLEGDAKAEMTITMAGDSAQKIKRTLNGQGDLLFKDGAIKGIDLAGMVQNVKAAFGLADRDTQGPRTDFSELHAPFTITNGVVNTLKTTLTSPALRASVTGKADLVNETLDFRVEPKFVVTLKGQGDTEERAGFMVPVLVTGSLTDPKFRPDLEGMIRKGLEERLPQASDLIKALPGQTKQDGDAGSLEDKAKDLLKQIPFGR